MCPKIKRVQNKPFEYNLGSSKPVYSITLPYLVQNYDITQKKENDDNNRQLIAKIAIDPNKSTHITALVETNN